MKNRKNSLEKTKVLVGMAIFTAIVVVLQVIATIVGRFLFTPPTLVLVPIVIGAASYGWKAGTWLGFVFGLVCFLAGFTGADPATFGMISYNAFGTALICIAKGALSGLFAGLVYRALQKKNQVLGTIAAAVVCPVVNTAIYLLGAVTMFGPYLTEALALAEASWTVILTALIAIIAVNFILEIVINVILSPVIVRVLKNRKLV